MQRKVNPVKEVIALGIFFYVGLLFAVTSPASGLSSYNVSLVFGSPIKEGDDLAMECLFVVPTNSTIYSVQWYRGTKEIFRYTPREQEKLAVPYLGLVVDIGRSDMHRLMLKGVPASMSGNWSCEVTPEDPKLNLVTKTAHLLVVVTPKERPHLTTSLGMTNHMLNLNQKMTANCTTSPSKPASNITFYINNTPLDPDDPNIGIHFHRETVKDDFEITIGELELQLHQPYFQHGQITLTCESSLFNVHNSSSDEFAGELVKPKSSNQNSFFGVLGAAPVFRSGLVTAFTQFFTLLTYYRHVFQWIL